jgi:hypothetical protein
LTNLRRELHLLRRALPEPDALILIEHRTVQWRSDGPFGFDVAEFEAAVERGRRGDSAAFEEALPALRRTAPADLLRRLDRVPSRTAHGLHLEASNASWRTSRAPRVPPRDPAAAPPHPARSSPRVALPDADADRGVGRGPLGRPAGLPRGRDEPPS